MFDGDLDHLVGYIGYVAGELDLMGWEFTINEEEIECDGESMVTLAEVRHPVGRRWAEIAFSEGWAEWGEERLRHVVCHELIHCITNPMKEPLDAVEAHLGQAAYTVAKELYRNIMERSVDHLAVAFAKKIDLPSTWFRRYNES